MAEAIGIEEKIKRDHERLLRQTCTIENVPPLKMTPEEYLELAKALESIKE